MSKKFSKILSVLLATVVCMTAVPVFAASIGSSANDISVGADAVQGAKTEYSTDKTTTDVYMTVDGTGAVAGVPTSIILNGSRDENGKHIGKYQIGVSGDIAGDEILQVYPESTDIKMHQTGKDDIDAVIEQGKTEFTATDVSNSITTDGKITADSLTAGSWNSNFDWIITMKNEFVYYSSIERAVSDASALTTDNADVLRKDIVNAEAMVMIDGDTARVYLLKDADNVGQLTFVENAYFDLGGHTVDFAEGCGIIYDNSLTVNNGVFSFVDASGIVGKNNDVNTSFVCHDTDMNFIVNSDMAEPCYAVDTSSAYSDIADCNIVMLGDGSTNYNVNGLCLRGAGAVRDCTWDIDIPNAKQVTSTQVNANDVVYKNCSWTVKNEHIIRGLRVITGDVTKTVKFENISLNLSSENATSVSGISMGAPCTVEVYGCDIYSCGKNVETAGSGISSDTAEGKLTIIEDELHPVKIFAKCWTLSLSCPTVINGGTYISKNHTGYFSNESIIENAMFYVDNAYEGYMESSFGLYCGGPLAKEPYDVTFKNCVIGNPDMSVQQYEAAITSTRNNGYIPPVNINLYDCVVYSGYETFSYGSVRPNDNRLINSSFNLYGDTHVYKTNGTEFTKVEIANDITTWKGSPVATGVGGLYSTSIVGSTDRFVRTHSATVDASTGEISTIRLSDNSNVYDYR